MKIETLLKFVGVRKFSGQEVAVGKIKWWRGVFLWGTMRDVCWVAPLPLNRVLRFALWAWHFFKYIKGGIIEYQAANDWLRLQLKASEYREERLRERIGEYERRELERLGEGSNKPGGGEQWEEKEKAIGAIDEKPACEGDHR